MSATHLIVHIAFGAVCASAGQARCADGYPLRSIRFLVAFPPGGGADTIARVVGQDLGDRLGQPILIDNRAGAGGNLAAEIAARAAPDGYTMLQATVGHAIAATLYAKPGFDLMRDFDPVTLLGSTPFVLVAIPSLPATSISELLALAKARPLNYASSGNGSPSHLAMEMFRSAARVDIQHIPYKGVAPAMTDLLGGQVMMMFSTVAPALPLIRTGKLRALGMASRIRSATATDVPTIAESGLQGFEASTWFGVLVPTGTPRSVVTSLNAQMTAILRQPATRSRLVAQGFDVIGNSPAEFGAFIKDELARWSQAVKKSGARID